MLTLEEAVLEICSQYAPQEVDKSQAASVMCMAQDLWFEDGDAAGCSSIIASLVAGMSGRTYAQAIDAAKLRVESKRGQIKSDENTISSGLIHAKQTSDYESMLESLIVHVMEDHHANH